MRCDAKWMIVGAAAFAATACTPVDPGFGDSFRYDMAIQTIDPEPVYPEGGAQPGASGEKGAKATERYRKGTTKPVQRETISGGSSSGGGSSGGSGGPG